MNLNPDGTLDFLITDSGATDYASRSTSVIGNDTWYHIVGVYNGSRVWIYINGVMEDTDAAGTINYGAGGVALGRDGDASSLYDKGLIDDVRIYNRILSPDEIKRLYNMGR